MSSTPSKKEIVQAVMRLVRTETKTFVDPTGEEKSKAFVSYQCPKNNCPVGIVHFAEKPGFTNPHRHLKTCFANGKPVSERDLAVIELYKTAIEKSRVLGGTIRSHFSLNLLSDYEKALHGYIRLIVMRNLPVKIAEDEEMRAFSRHKSRISYRTVTSTILFLVKLVEKRIANKMKNTKGALLFDGWTCCSTHYVAGIASYCSKQTGGTEVKARLSCVAVSPMGRVSNEEHDKDDETARFDAETHLGFFKDIFNLFGLSFDEWVLCLVCDNSQVNRKLVRISRKPGIGCMSHKLNLEVNRLIDKDTALSQVVNTVQTTMKSARKLKNAAMLRNITDYKAILCNETRWSGKRRMLDRFLHIFDELKKVSLDLEADLDVNVTKVFRNQVELFGKMLREIDAVTKSLQTRGHTLAACRDDVQKLISSVTAQRDTLGALLYKCKLGSHYIAENADISTSPVFETGVIKLQERKEDTLSRQERRAVATLLKNPSCETIDPASEPNDPWLPMKEQLAKRRKRNSSTSSKYIDCSFILGSVAEVERLWSTAKYILSENRQSMTPKLFEALLFLKLNLRFWDASLVSDAYRLHLVDEQEVLAVN